MYDVPMGCYNRNRWMQLTIDLYNIVIIGPKKVKVQKC